MTDGAAALLQQSALNGEAGIVEIEKRQHRLDRGAVQQVGIDAVQPHGIAAPCIGISLRIGVEEVQHATLGNHGVEIEILLQTFP